MENKLKKYIEDIEKLESEKSEIAKQITEIYNEAKNDGFDTKTMKKLIALRKLDNAEMHEQEHLLETYKQALGMQ